MRIGKATGKGMDVRITAFDSDGISILEMTWAEWDMITLDAEHLRRTGEMRDAGIA